ncbi:MAG: hypothetical protein OXG25_13635 [Gammaproteobacteria bacterium]|nr:hypothetical protein [Gammaproteobacteria bacterium]
MTLDQSDPIDRVTIPDKLSMSIGIAFLRSKLCMQSSTGDEPLVPNQT